MSIIQEPDFLYLILYAQAPGTESHVKSAKFKPIVEAVGFKGIAHGVKVWKTTVSDHSEIFVPEALQYVLTCQ